VEGFHAAARLLPPALREAAERLPDADRRACEEFRLRRGRSASVLIGGTERPFGAAAVSGEDIRYAAEAATRSSLHAAVGELSQGFLSADGGVRVGVCGTAAGDGGLRSFSSLAIRVPRAVRGCADGIWARLTEGGFSSLLILSPPGAGKTTLLRELVRRLSNDGLRVAVADERGELAASRDGVPGFDLGPRTDVMTGVPKARAAAMLVRSMNPQALAMDEVTDEADAAALLRAAGCGVALLASVHAATLSELSVRPACRQLLEAKVFARFVLVENRGGVRRYTAGALP